MQLIPHSLQTLLTALSVCIFAGCGESGSVGLEPELEPEVEHFVQLMNVYRESVGCPALAWDASVAAVAEDHSDDMVTRDFFDHTNPDGKSPFDRLNDAGVAWSSAAENIAFGFPTGESVLETWIMSPGHRANIENCSFSRHGVGLSGTHWTHVFLRP